MLRSSNCVLTGKTPMEFSKLNECPLDPGRLSLNPSDCLSNISLFVCHRIMQIIPSEALICGKGHGAYVR